MLTVKVDRLDRHGRRTKEMTLPDGATIKDVVLKCKFPRRAYSYLLKMNDQYVEFSTPVIAGATIIVGAAPI